MSSSVPSLPLATAVTVAVPPFSEMLAGVTLNVMVGFGSLSAANPSSWMSPPAMASRPRVPTDSAGASAAGL